MNEEILMFIQKEIDEILQKHYEISEDFFLRETQEGKYLEIASLELVELIIRIEDAYNIELSMVEIEKIETIENLINITVEKVDENEKKESRICEIEKKLFG